MKKKILIVSHCILNSASKVVSCDSLLTEEFANRKKLMQYIINNDIELLQLPCPEFLLYGSNRWGHVKEQFDNPFFKGKCEEILKDIIFQIKEYISNDRFCILGICGINGSPSCGVDYTCSSKQWYGEFSSKSNISETISSVKCIPEKGVFISVLSEMLEKENIQLPFVAVDQNNMEKVYNILK